MVITFYNNKSNHNVINKVLEQVTTLSFHFKDDTSIITPKLILKGYIGGNYAYIPALKRYYFIDDIRMLKGGLYELDLSVDVLVSYQADIISNSFYSETGNYSKIDSLIDFDTIYDNTKFLLIIGG